MKFILNLFKTKENRTKQIELYNRTAYLVNQDRIAQKQKQYN